MDRSEAQVFTVSVSHDISPQLKSPQRIVCFCFEFVEIFFKDEVPSHR